MGSNTLTQRKLIEAAYKYHGDVNVIAKVFGCGRSAIHQRINYEPEVAQAFEEARDWREAELQAKNDEVLEMCYEALIELIKARDRESVLTALKYLGTKRGWMQVQSQPEAIPTHVVVESRNPRIAVQPERLSDEVRRGDVSGEEASVSIIS